jgi:acetyl esterase/lipase
LKKSNKKTAFSSFYCETLDYIEELRKARVPANVDVYPGGYHAFDIMNPDDDMSIGAAEKFCKEFLYAKENYFAPQLAEL